jgi:Putative salt-induced outer membrane protein
MTKRFPVVAILPFIVPASPAAAQPVDEWAVESVSAGPLHIEAPPFVDPVPFINSGPPSLSQPVKAMIEEAIRRDDSETVAAVVRMALATNPYDADEIRGMQRAYLDRRARALAQRTQAETDRIRNSGVLELWKGQVEFGAFRSTGNTSNFGFTGGLRLNRQGINWQHAILFNVDYQRDRGNVTRDQLGASYQPRYTLNEGFFTYGRIQYERDEIQGFENRYSFSGGLGYRLIDRPTMHLSLEAGPAMRRTNYVDELAETTWSALTSLDFDWKINDTMKLTQSASSYIGSDNNTFTSRTGLEAGMARGVKVKLSYSIEHETAPPIGSLKTDTISRFSLVYGF